MTIKKGDNLRCVKFFEMEEFGKFFVGGYNEVTIMDGDWIGLKTTGSKKLWLNERQINEHFVVDNRDEVKESADLPTYYDNTNGSLYKIAEQRGWGVRLFDLVKRLERGGKKDPLPMEIRKSIGVLELWLKEVK